MQYFCSCRTCKINPGGGKCLSDNESLDNEDDNNNPSQEDYNGDNDNPSQDYNNYNENYNGDNDNSSLDEDNEDMETEKDINDDELIKGLRLLHTKLYSVKYERKAYFWNDELSVRTSRYTKLRLSNDSNNQSFDVPFPSVLEDTSKSDDQILDDYDYGPFKIIDNYDNDNSETESGTSEEYDGFEEFEITAEKENKIWDDKLIQGLQIKGSLRLAISLFPCSFASPITDKNISSDKSFAIFLNSSDNSIDLSRIGGLFGNLPI
ncbi:hypothetical protein GLOIN_2v1524479 [Rhizophagus irregularis DAOM 181602=DAOM 197198]|nr:hypothetical protein GLOIN_2v1524479 [Rhizophagus irregularis DAOM 181602=DAOM 197198]GET63102.1 hypothetical protein GLOIN_2v1524479 [Rhizophagus irregularis DAOM 181602=DAOM 197198]